ncbi:MAG TPA: DUF2079 domain-containing protein [Polyangiales bacterium]|nr:DUF2079 domain-containing protein [Polyangiales bacterium]
MTERSDTAAPPDVASSGPSDDGEREVPREKPQRTRLLAGLGAALPWSELVLAVAQLAMVSGSLLLAVHLFRLPEADLDAFLSGNRIEPALRSKLLMQLLAALLLPAVAAAGLLTRYGFVGARWLIAAASRLCPLVVACFLPTLLNYRQWYNQPLPYLVMLLGVVLLLEQLIERAVRGPDAVTGVVRLERASIPRSGSHLVPLVFVSLFALGYSLQASYFTIIRHHGMQSAGFDLGIFDNLFFNATRLQPFRSTVAVPNGSYLSNHAEYGIMLFAPLYALFPRAETLLVLQSFFIGFAAVPLYFFASTRLPRGISAALACVYPFYAPLHGPNFYDFHWMPISMLFFFWLFYAIARRQKLTIVLLFLVICSIREDAPFGLIATGLFLIVTGEWPLLGAVMTAVAGAWFVVVKFVIMPWAGPWWFANIYKDLVAAGESGYGSVVKTILVNPNYFIQTLLNETKLIYTLHLFAPLALLPVRRAALWLLMLPGFFVTLMTTGYAPTTSITFQYTTHWVPFLFGAVVIAVSLRGERSGRAAQVASISALCFGVLCHSYVFGSVFQHEKFVGGFSKVRFTLSPAEKLRYQNLRALADMIPISASVAATELEIPHVSNRRDAYSLKVEVGHPDYLLFSRYHIDDGSRHQLRKAMEEADFGLLATKDEYFLFKKGHQAEGTEAALKQLGLSLKREKPRRRDSGSLVGPGRNCLALDLAKNTEALVRDCSSDSAQRWELALDTGQLKYRPQPDKCLAMPGANNGDPLQARACTEQSTHWSFDRITIHAYGELCLDLLGGNTSDGAEIGVWTCLANENQKWSVSRSGEIRWAGGMAETRCLGVQEVRDGAQLTLQRCDGSASQKFSFSANKIHHGGKCVDLRSPEDRMRRGMPELPGDGWRALLFPCEAPQTNQEWHFSGPIRQGTKCIDSRPYRNGDGSPVDVWDCTDENQVWDLHF